MTQPTSRTDRFAALRIVAIYAVVAVLWIFLSDSLLGLLTQEPATIILVGHLKGVAFILVTGALLYRLISRKIYEVRQVEEELHASRNLLSALVEGTTDAVYAKDLQGRYLFFNAAAEKFTGKTAAEAIGHDDTLLFPAEEAAALMAGDRRVMGSRQVSTYEEYLQVADGGHRTFLATKGPLYAADGSLIGLFGIARDISERKSMEQTLMDNEMMLQRAEAIAHVGHLRIDLDSERSFCSEELCRIFGAGNGTCRSINFNCVKQVHPDDLEAVSRAYEKIHEEGGQQVEFRIVRPDGELRHVIGYGELVASPAGVPKAMFGTLMDVTELRLKERDLREKNAELERFIYSVSHDLKSPLITVKTFLGYLEDDLKDNAGRIASDMFYISSAADKMGRLLDSLLEMSRIGRQNNPSAEITVRELVDDVLNSLAGVISERGVALSVDLDDVILYGDRVRLGQIWQNLVENAVKFMGDQPAPQIRIGVQRENGEPVFFVCDNGMGIDSRDSERVFNLFEKLDPQMEGTGMGLALVKRIVEFNGGGIRLESAGPGTGCCARFTLQHAASRRSPEGA